MATQIWVNIGSGNDLLPDGTKPLPEPMLTHLQISPMTFIWRHIIIRSLDVKIPINKTRLKIVLLKLIPDLAGTNELKWLQFGLCWLLLVNLGKFESCKIQIKNYNHSAVWQPSRQHCSLCLCLQAPEALCFRVAHQFVRVSVCKITWNGLSSLLIVC